MPREIERKFLLESIEPLAGLWSEHTCLEISQGYLPVKADETDRFGEVRLRYQHCGNMRDYSITTKIDTQYAEEREEATLRIPRSVYALMWPATLGMRLNKRRYPFQYDGREFVLDVYTDQYKGLYIVECEFGSLYEARRFNSPHWLKAAREVTGDAKYKNRNLAGAKQ